MFPINGSFKRVLFFISFSLVTKHWPWLGLKRNFTSLLQCLALVDDQWVLAAAVKINTNNILVGSGYYYLLGGLDPLGGEFLISLADTQLVCHNWWITSLSSMFLAFSSDRLYLEASCPPLLSMSILNFLVQVRSLLARLTCLSVLMNHPSKLSCRLMVRKEDNRSKLVHSK